MAARLSLGRMGGKAKTANCLRNREAQAPGKRLWREEREGLGGGVVLTLLHVPPEIENHLNGFGLRPVLVVAVNVTLQLSTVSDNLLTPLLKCNEHMDARRCPNVAPQSWVLLAAMLPDRVLRSNGSALRVMDVLLPHSPRQLIGALPDQI